MSLILRPYQHRAVIEVQAAWNTHRRILLALPTGGGKTEVAIALASDEIAAGRRVLVVVERKVLCHQWRERLHKHGFSYVGVLQGENTIATAAPVLVATAQTLRARGIPEGVALVILDESHVWHQTHDRVLEACGDAKVLGLSATPLRAGLGTRFDRLVVGATIRELTTAGYLVAARVFAPNRATIGEALENVGVRAGDFAVDELSTAMRAKAVIGDVVSSWREHGENRQTICFCVDKAHARDLADEFEVDGIPAAVIVDETSDEDRADLFQRFEAGQIKVLSSVGVLAVGFDSPIAGCAILARPTLSTMLHVQQAGRVIHPYPGKVDAIILDHAANTLRHGLPIDFQPPADLSTIDKRTDKKLRRTETSDVVACRECDALYPRAEDACPECGTPRTRYTKAVILDGALVRVSWDSNQPEPGGATADDVREFYCEMLAVCAMKGWKAGAAWFKTCERFKLPSDFHDQTTSTLLPRAWRSNAGAIDPTQETLRWVENQRRQRNAIERSSRQAAA